VARKPGFFIAGEEAPNARQAFEGAVIINQLGNVAITELRTSGEEGSKVEFDYATRPHTLRLRSARAVIQHGRTDNEEFISRVFILDGLVSGDYTGPGSQLEVTE